MLRKKLCLFAAALTVLGGCKIQVDAPEGGGVTTQSGTYSCSAGESCTVDVVDIFFDETFIATPGVGYEFSGWQKRQRGFCGGSDSACALRTTEFEGNEALTRFLESPEEVFFLTPVFNEVVVDAFDPDVFLSTRFEVRREGVALFYTFRENGSYGFVAPSFGGLTASGTYEFQRGNRVIFYSAVADSQNPGRPGYGVFDSFSRSLNAYIICEVSGDLASSAAQAENLCLNGPRFGAGAPERVRYNIED